MPLFFVFNTSNSALIQLRYRTTQALIMLRGSNTSLDVPRVDDVAFYHTLERSFPSDFDLLAFFVPRRKGKASHSQAAKISNRIRAQDDRPGVARKRSKVPRGFEFRVGVVLRLEEADGAVAIVGWEWTKRKTGVLLRSSSSNGSLMLLYRVAPPLHCGTHLPLLSPSASVLIQDAD